MEVARLLRFSPGSRGARIVTGWVDCCGIHVVACTVVANDNFKKNNCNLKKQTKWLFQPSCQQTLWWLWNCCKQNVTTHNIYWMALLEALQWLKVKERIEYKKGSTVFQSTYLRDIITIQPSRSTRSPSLVTLLHPQAQSSLKITNRSFRYAAPHLWNHLHLSVFLVSRPPPLPGSDSAPKSMVGVSHGVFHSRLKTHLFSRSFPP